ncbi:MAG: hypothetical protein RLZZ209_1170, partial [Bacteroidota bacterium]
TQAPSPINNTPNMPTNFRMESFENFSSKVNDLR